jgi:hypothetical protein
MIVGRKARLAVSWLEVGIAILQPEVSTFV